MTGTDTETRPEPVSLDQERLEQLERRLEASRVSRDGWTFTIFAIAALAVIASVIGLALAWGDDDGGGASPGGGGAGAVPLVLDVELGDLYVRPSSVEVAPGTELIVNVTNAGAVPHDLKLLGETGTDLLDPGENQQVSLGVIDGNTEAWCTVPGHRAAGMVLDIRVAGAGEAASAGEAQAVASADSDAAVIDFAATPAADWQPYDPTLAPAPGGTEHELTLRATETVVEVAPGVTQELWMFNDQFPGPALRGKVGDIFTVTLVNEGELGHSIDFHASKVAWDDEMRTIQPGESLVYQFEAKHAGVWMYHCGTAPALHHIGNGMFGAIIIDPPELAPVDHEFLFVQSELYLGPEGQPGDLTKMQDEDNDAVVFNGYVNQYQHAPIRVEQGERIRVFVLDAGPSENSAFHIVGTIFDTVYKEGTYLLRPDERNGGSQALDLQPSQGGFVEFTFDEEGLYLMVTHKFSNVGIGALGVFQAGDVDASGAAH
jgi:nitrite reductase (NO-forming)